MLIKFFNLYEIEIKRRKFCAICIVVLDIDGVFKSLI